MTLEEFENKFTINPIKDIQPYFKFDKKLDEDAFLFKGCYNCRDQSNQIKLKSMDWTSVIYCWKCKTLNVVYFSDGMGGNYTDTIECYKEKIK
jgi:hypothetical protein